MLGSAILEVAIGVVFVFVLVSIICSAIREGMEAWLKTRAAYLERGIRNLLHDVPGRGLARRFYEHPLIYGLYSGDYRPAIRSDRLPLLASGGRLPSYIPAGNFAAALLDIAARGPDPAVASDPRAPVLSLENVRASVIALDNEPVQRALLTAIDAAQGSLDQARRNLEAWYDSGMDRVSGWYKRSTQWVIFWIGLGVAVALNVNTITIAQHLYRDNKARAAVVALAEGAAADAAKQPGDHQAARKQLEQLELPIGWSRGLDAGSADGTFHGPQVLVAVLGWLVTALAATLGAPFWFDLLNKMMVIRATVKPREKSPEEGSEDRQPQAAKTPASAESAAPVAAPAAPALPPGAAPSAPQPPPVVEPAPLLDGCDVPKARVTSDEDLPVARGGVA